MRPRSQAGSDSAAGGRTIGVRLLWTAISALPLLGWLACSVLPAAAGSGAAREPEPAAALPAPVDFDSCAKLALQQSPYFAKSALEIEVRRLDEQDSKSDYLPTINLRAKYYLSQPSRANLSNPTDYAVDVAVESWNPLTAHFGVKVRQLLKQVAVLSHLQIISQGLKELGNGFLEMEAVSRLQVLQGKILEVAGQNLTYAQRRLELGEISHLEVKIAAQELEVAKLEQERWQETHKRLQEQIRSFLGLKPSQALRFATHTGARQVLGEAERYDWEALPPRSLEGRIENLKKELQSWHITLAKLRLLPGLTAAVQTPDPITLTGVRGYFFSVGLTWPVFDGFKRLRDVSRQKTMLSQAEAEAEVKERDFRSKWREVQQKIKTSRAAWQLSLSQLALATLKERQGELKYQGGEALALALAARRARLEAEGQAILKQLEYQQALLEGRHLCGDLVRRYVSEGAWLP